MRRRAAPEKESAAGTSRAGQGTRERPSVVPRALAHRLPLPAWPREKRGFSAFLSSVLLTGPGIRTASGGGVTRSPGVRRGRKWSRNFGPAPLRVRAPPGLPRRRRSAAVRPPCCHIASGFGRANIVARRSTRSDL